MTTTNSNRDKRIWNVNLLYSGEEIVKATTGTLAGLLEWIERYIFGTLFHSKVRISLIIVTILFAASSLSIHRIIPIRTALALYTGVGCLAWYLIFAGLKGFSVFLNPDRESLLSQEESKVRLWFFELATFLIPFGLLWYKYWYTNERILPRLQSEPNVARELILEQIEREVSIMENIPVVLFGVGVIFEQQQFFHNKYLLAGVLMGSVVPYLIRGLITDSTDLRNLIIIENTIWTLVVIGSMLIVVAIFKYNNYKTDLKKRKRALNNLPGNPPNYEAIGKKIVEGIESIVATDMSARIKECVDMSL